MQTLAVLPPHPDVESKNNGVVDGNRTHEDKEREGTQIDQRPKKKTHTHKQREGGRERKAHVDERPNRKKDTLSEKERAHREHI